MRDEIGFGWPMQADVCKPAPLFPAKEELHALFFLNDPFGHDSRMCRQCLFSAGYDTVRGTFLVQEGLPERPDWGHAFRYHMTLRARTASHQRLGLSDRICRFGIYHGTKVSRILADLSPTAAHAIISSQRIISPSNSRKASFFFLLRKGTRKGKDQNGRRV